jgi:hypothetical protein
MNGAMSHIGTKRTYVCYLAAFGGKADISNHPMTGS